jgi:MFS family permease
MNAFMSSSLNVALPTIGREYNLDAMMMSWVVTSLIVTAAMFLVPFGRLADLFGRRKIFFIGLIIFTISTTICPFTPTAQLLILFRAIQGIGFSAIIATAVALVTGVYPPNERGAALGWISASAYFGLSSGPILGGLITSAFGWRAIFFISAPLGLILVVMTGLKLRQEWVSAKGEPFDLIGSIFYAIPLLVIMYGITLLPEWHGLIPVIAGIIGLVVFVIWENPVDFAVVKVF